jgi:hypothetical protein
MRKLIPTQFVTHLLLLVMTVTMVHGVHESAHAMQGSILAGDAAVTQGELSAPHECPCPPPVEHQDYDGCDNCINCSCHALLRAHALVLNYAPVIASLHFSAPFQFLPEVFLPKFVPPQILS